MTRTPRPEREVAWASMLTVSMAIWALHFAVTVPPMFGLRWLQVLATASLFFACTIRVWRGRREA